MHRRPGTQNFLRTSRQPFSKILHQPLNDDKNQEDNSETHHEPVVIVGTSGLGIARAPWGSPFKRHQSTLGALKVIQHEATAVSHLEDQGEGGAALRVLGESHGPNRDERNGGKERLRKAARHK
jgi:hypothetical protein